MLSTIKIIGISIVILLIGLARPALSQSTRLTFFINHDLKSPQDYMQISANITATSTSLKQALAQVQQKINKVENSINTFCFNHSKTDLCKDLTEKSLNHIEPLYRLISKKPTFVGFEVQYEMIGKIFSPEEMGQLVDQLKQMQAVSINGLDWTPFDLKKEEAKAISSGLSQAQKRCRSAGMKLNRVQSIEEITEIQVDEEYVQQDLNEQELQQDIQQEQYTQQELDVLTYKFVVECSGKIQSKTKRRSK